MGRTNNEIRFLGKLIECKSMWAAQSLSFVVSSAGASTNVDTTMSE